VAFDYGGPTLATIQTKTFPRPSFQRGGQFPSLGRRARGDVSGSGRDRRPILGRWFIPQTPVFWGPCPGRAARNDHFSLVHPNRPFFFFFFGPLRKKPKSQGRRRRARCGCRFCPRRMGLLMRGVEPAPSPSHQHHVAGIRLHGAGPLRLSRIEKIFPFLCLPDWLEQG